MKYKKFLVGSSAVVLFVGVHATIRFFPKLCPARASISAEAFPAPEQWVSFREAQAIPVFARKYQTSCQTCHTAFPHLTPFGKAFKNNGLRWPGEDRDPAYEKPEKPISLGAKAYEQMWPWAVWPGEIPGLPPVALSALSQYVSRPRSGAANEKNQFQGFGSQFTLLSSGTLGRSFSLWGGIGFNLQVNQNTGTVTTNPAIERLYSVITPFDRPVFTIRVGSFEPRLTAISVASRSKGPSRGLNSRASQAAGWATLSASLRGLETPSIVKRMSTEGSSTNWEGSAPMGSPMRPIPPAIRGETIPSQSGPLVIWALLQSGMLLERSAKRIVLRSLGLI